MGMKFNTFTWIKKEIQGIPHWPQLGNLCTKSTVLWMHQDGKSGKYRQSLRQCRLQFWRLWIFAFSFCESLYRHVVCFSFLSFQHSSFPVCSMPHVVAGVNLFLTGISVTCFALVYILTLFAYSLARFSNILCGCRMCWWSIQFSKVFKHPLWLQDVLMIIWENHQNHRKFTVAEEQLHLEPKLL